MIQDEGYIKFNPSWNKSPISIDASLLIQLNEIRAQLQAKNWLGVLPNGIGFGNISIREKESNQFIITGSATGKYSQLKEEHFSLVNHVTIEENKLECTGQIMASSESMSHAAVYIHNKKIKAIIHIHDNNLWKKYLNKLPSSSINAAYGTPQMALSIAEKIKQLKTNSGVLIMGGHSDGIIAFGNNLDNAILLLQKL
ncbi:MAG: class II aldolase/adducin family protein [Prolixibacteraceae bacterium]|jgi:L-ribulose-5-phosphate 4-epimerase|nr:class II aldolase/adducin family protein [Prolixibacteraceae bacterium]